MYKNELLDEIFRVFDYNETGNITIERIFFLFLTIFETELNDGLKFSDEGRFQQEINQRFQKFLSDIQCFHGRVRAYISNFSRNRLH